MASNETSRQIERRARRLAHRLGWMGLGGGVLLLMAFIELMTGAWSVDAQSRDLQLRIARMQESPRLGRPIETKASGDATGQLDAFDAFFPARSKLADSLKKIYAAAAASSLTLPRGDYRLEVDRDLGLTRYQLTLPVNAQYSRIKQFVGTVLAELPNAALEGVSMQRSTTGDQELETVIRISLFFRGQS